MKKLLTLSLTLLFAVSAFAQPPKTMSYQCVVRDASGDLVKNQSVGLRISILEGSASGTVAYEETYSPNPQTNINGLVTIEIGGGTPVIGTFSSINWASGKYFLKTETDPDGGINYTIVGTSQLLSVPYALYSEKTGTYTETDPVWTGISGNYYTKTNLQTGGQALVNWNNLTSINADVLDLATDGILTGSKVGAGISAANITAGTLPLARLSGITTTQLSATAGITTGQITSLAANKVTGISENFVPRSNGTGLTNGTIFDNGTQVGFGGGFVPEAQLHLRNYSGPQLKIGSSNQPAWEWYFTVSPAAALSLLNEGNGIPFTALYIDNVTGNVGLGTTSTTAKLVVNGQVRIAGGTPAAGQVLTSDATGLATWEPPAVVPPTQVYFEVKRDASYQWPLNATVQKIDFSSNSTVWENQGNAFNTTTSTFTAPSSGIYAFNGAIHFESISAGYLIYAMLTAGNRTYEGAFKYASSSIDGVTISMTLFLTAGETVQLWGYLNDPTAPGLVYGNTATGYAFTYFTGAKVN